MSMALCAPVSAADRISIARIDCDTGVHLVAHAVPLPALLERLSQVLGFQLQLMGSSDSIIDVDIARHPPELIAKLSAVDNIIVSQTPDPRCPGRFRISKVWLLSKVPGGLQRPAAEAASAPAMSEAEKQQIREADNAYRRAHGMPPLSD